MHGVIEVGRDPVCAMATAITLRDIADAHTVAGADEVLRDSLAVLDADAGTLVLREAPLV